MSSRRPFQNYRASRHERDSDQQIGIAQVDFLPWLTSIPREAGKFHRHPPLRWA
jgi:hypothetical protein